MAVRRLVSIVPGVYSDDKIIRILEEWNNWRVAGMVTTPQFNGNTVLWILFECDEAIARMDLDRLDRMVNG
jgi:hypothetical protein